MGGKDAGHGLIETMNVVMGGGGGAFEGGGTTFVLTEEDDLGAGRACFVCIGRWVDSG